MNKRILSIFMVVFVFMGLLPTTVLAAEGDPCRYAQSEGCTGTYTAAGYCNVCSRNEAGNSCAHDLASQGSGWVCTQCDKFYDICPHLGYDIQTNRCYVCGTCRHYFTENFPHATHYTSNGGLTHTVTVRCSVCLFVVSETKEDHTILSEATCLKKAVCEQCGEFDASTYYHENPTPTYTESAENSVMHEIRYECCGTVTTEEHRDEDGDSACDACGSTNLHEHSFVYTYEKHPSLKNTHYIIKSCTGCNTTFERTTETCAFIINCQGSVCPKCGNTDTSTFPGSHASTEISYIDNGDGTHTGKYVCCGVEYETVAHDENCELCNVHKHILVYSYGQPEDNFMIIRRLHYVYQSCTGCDESFADTREGCSVSVTCKGQVCLKCGYQYGNTTAPDVHASEEITYNDNGDGTHSGVYACCNAAYVTDEAHTYGDNNTCVCGAVQKIISVNITWGGMNFTYTDENGWTDNGTGWVEVENTGNTLAIVTANYQNNDGFNFTGTFEETTTDNITRFVLLLSGRPTQVLNGEQIGKVTLTIE